MSLMILILKMLKKILTKKRVKFVSSFNKSLNGVKVNLRFQRRNFSYNFEELIKELHKNDFYYYRLRAYYVFSTSHRL